MIDVQHFQELRPYLFSVAYRMLGSASESEDALQDAWLRAASAPDDVQSERAWLTTVVTRLCLDRLKSARAAREQYVGPWLPEPAPTSSFDLEESAMRGESITMAFLVLLETLSPAERAAFLLREVFEYDYAEVARILENSESASRQLVHRAKERLAERRPRFQASPERQREVVNRFLQAAEQGELRDLEEFLTADVVSVADGGGKATAAGRPLHGRDTVGKFLSGLWRLGMKQRQADPDAWRLETADVNGEPALLVWVAGRLETVMVFSLDDADRIYALNIMRNPDKLAWIARQMASRKAETV